MTRLLIGGALVVSWLGGTALGLTAAAFRTEAGRRLVVGWAVAAANARLNGTLHVGAAGGSFLDGLVLTDVELRDATGETVAQAGRLALRYRLADLVGGRLAFGQLVVERLQVNLVQPHPGAPFNLETLLPPGDAAQPGRLPLVAFTDVRIADASVVIRTPADPSAVEGQARSAGSPKLRRIANLAARLPYLRLASPRAGEDAILVEIAALRGRLSDPALDVAELRGRIEVWGDSLRLALPWLRVGETRGALQGSVSWSTEHLALDLAARAEHLVTDELHGLVPGLPSGLSGRGAFAIRSRGADVLVVEGRELALSGGARGGRVEGRLGLALGPGDEWAVRRTELSLHDFDLEYLRRYVDTLPIAGRMDGVVRADGSRQGLQLDLAARFRDSLVEGRPATRLRARGRVALDGADGMIFRGLVIDDADVSLATVRRLAPAVAARGRLGLSGTLEGSWRDITFAGELRHQDAPLPETVARGTVRLDTRGETLGVWADLAFDSLRLAGWQSSFPGVEVGATFAGQLRLAGYLDSLSLGADLHGPAGRVVASGALVATDARRGVRELHVELRGVDGRALQPALPSTRLFGGIVARGDLASDGGAELHLRVGLDTVEIAGVRLDSLRAALTVGDSVLRFEPAELWARGLSVVAQGSVGLAAPRSGALAVTAHADSVALLEPLVTRWLGPPDSAARRFPLSGSVAASATVRGALDSFRVSGSLWAARLRRGTRFVSRIAADGVWESHSRALRLGLELDSLALGDRAFGGVALRVRGRPDSLRWEGRGRFGADGAWVGGGRLARDSLRTVAAIDSLGLLLATGAWFVEPVPLIALSDSGLEFSDAALASARHAGRVALTGRLPFAGSGGLVASVAALPVKDLWALRQLDPEEVGGELSGTLELRGRARAPEISVRVALRDGVFGALRTPYLEGVLHYTDRRLTGDVSLWRAGEEIFTVHAALPVDLALTEVEHRRLPGPVSVRAVANGVDLSFLDAVTPLIRGTGGTLDADFGITGSWERPRLTGRLAVTDGRATFPALGVRHEQLNGLLVLRGDTIAVERLSLKSGAGVADVRGFVRLAELTRPLLHLQISARNFRAIEVRDFLTLTASGELELTGPLLGAALTGRATAGRGTLYFADLVEKEIVNLEDTLFAGLVDTSLIRRYGLGPELESRFLDSLRIEGLRVEMGSDMWMRSGEANIQLSGAVTVSKLGDRYRLTGTLQTPRGTYRLEIPLAISKEFTVTRGQVRYFGTPDLDADLDIEARHVVRTVRGEPVTIFVHIGGTLYEPRLTLSSDIRPPISETEIISYLLFGAPSVQAFAGDRGAENRLLVQQVSQQLLSVVSGQLEHSLISNLGIPVDYLQIRPGVVGSALAGTEIAIGKQFRLLGTTAFLTARPRLCRGLAVRDIGASLEFRLSREWLLAASADPSRSCAALAGAATHLYQFGLDILWETSY